MHSCAWKRSHVPRWPRSEQKKYQGQGGQSRWIRMMDAAMDPEGVISATIAQKPFTMSYFGVRVLDDLVHHKLPRGRQLGAGSQSSSFPVFGRHRSHSDDRANVESYLKERTTASSGCRRSVGHGGMNTSVSFPPGIWSESRSTVSASPMPDSEPRASKQALSAPQPARLRARSHQTQPGDSQASHMGASQRS